VDLTAPVPTHLLRPRRVKTHRALPWRPEREVSLGPRRRGHKLAVALRPPRKERPAAGALVPVPVRREPTHLGRRLPSRALEPWRGVARGPLVRAVGGELFSLWGKSFQCCGFCLPVPLPIFLIYRSFLRLKRTLEQAQPSMAKQLKTGAASKEPGS